MAKFRRQFKDEARQVISVEALMAQGYREDREAKRAFDGPYTWLTIPGLLLFLGSYPLARYVVQPWRPHWEVGLITFFLALPVFPLAFGTHLHAKRKIPLSKVNHLPLTRYERMDIDQSQIGLEYVYVDHTRKTYFTRVFEGKSD